ARDIADQFAFATKPIYIYEIPGIEQLDYMDLVKKFSFGQTGFESYRLDDVAAVLLDQKKLDYSEYRSLHELYKQNYQKFIEYNIRDVYLVDKMEQQLGSISLCCTFAFMALVNFSDVFSPVATWDSILYTHLRKQKI